MKFTDDHPLHVARGDAVRQWFARNGGKINHPAYCDLIGNLAASITAGVGSRPLVVSVAGSQGSGKSTLAKLLAQCLYDVFSVKSASLSLDDFYLTRSDRQALAGRVHPMLATRGVPGTHDLALMNEALTRLRMGSDALVPVFDKAEDDRRVERRLVPASAVVLCEGWCWGARPQHDDALTTPVNDLEAGQDPDAAWRTFVNRSLADYQTVFASDGFVFLRVPDMEAVYRWRWEQEEALVGSGGAGVMDEQGVRRFIGFYERLTRWMLEDCPGRADVLVNLDDQHQVADVRYGR